MWKKKSNNLLTKFKIFLSLSLTDYLYRASNSLEIFEKSYLYFIAILRASHGRNSSQKPLFVDPDVCRPLPLFKPKPKHTQINYRLKCVPCFPPSSAPIPIETARQRHGKPNKLLIYTKKNEENKCEVGRAPLLKPIFVGRWCIRMYRNASFMADYWPNSSLPLNLIKSICKKEKENCVRRENKSRMTQTKKQCAF